MDWLQTVTELTNPMNARQAIVDVEVLDALDFETPCGNPIHDTGEWGHAGSAAYIVYGKCSCPGRVTCAGATAVFEILGAECTQCGDISKPEDIRAVPLMGPR